uniref:Uncharacterized protein n=1 Tax=Branchiostoma floridae TaxID=7739 RepID=C3ZM28_BRAFL|eukprot:XP_002590273.1 hypothetical protein BRAFLDRAFT_76519 [Branchiostoma floridae]
MTGWEGVAGNADRRLSGILISLPPGVLESPPRALHQLSFPAGLAGVQYRRLAAGRPGAGHGPGAARGGFHPPMSPTPIGSYRLIGHGPTRPPRLTGGFHQYRGYPNHKQVRRDAPGAVPIRGNSSETILLPVSVDQASLPGFTCTPKELEHLARKGRTFLPVSCPCASLRSTPVNNKMTGSTAHTPPSHPGPDRPASQQQITGSSCPAPQHNTPQRHHSAPGDRTNPRQACGYSLQDV